MAGCEVVIEASEGAGGDGLVEWELPPGGHFVHAVFDGAPVAVSCAVCELRVPLRGLVALPQGCGRGAGRDDA